MGDQKTKICPKCGGIMGVRLGEFKCPKCWHSEPLEAPPESAAPPFVVQDETSPEPLVKPVYPRGLLVEKWVIAVLAALLLLPGYGKGPLARIATVAPFLLVAVALLGRSTALKVGFAGFFGVVGLMVLVTSLLYSRVSPVSALLLLVPGAILIWIARVLWQDARWREAARESQAALQYRPRPVSWLGFGVTLAAQLSLGIWLVVLPPLGDAVVWGMLALLACVLILSLSGAMVALGVWWTMQGRPYAEAFLIASVVLFFLLIVVVLGVYVRHFL